MNAITRPEISISDGELVTKPEWFETSNDKGVMFYGVRNRTCAHVRLYQGIPNCFKAAVFKKSGLKIRCFDTFEEVRVWVEQNWELRQ